MEPFVIATETSYYTQNVFIRIHTDAGITGMGECSAFPMLVGETQQTCYEVAKDFARILRDKDPLEIEERMKELHDYIAFNTTIKSAFDMALHDIAAKHHGQPLYAFLGGKRKTILSDLTIGIAPPKEMAATAIKFIEDGVQIIKIKLGKNAKEDVERVRLIREAVGPSIQLRIDANQGWSYEDAIFALDHIAPYEVAYCEQPMRRWNDPLLPALRKRSPIKIMADESVFDHFDAIRLIEAGACDYINIKLAKTGGMLEAKKVAEAAAQRNTPCMLGGMVESRLALTAKVHFAMSQDNIIFYDLDTCLLGHLSDPVVGGAVYNRYYLEVTDAPGIDADIDPSFLKDCEQCVI
jgi:L-alanine-DL-glutamate epimerase-like enolase superfamily enzyme